MGRVPDLVIFDCDGVLVDSERIAVELDVQICAEFGLALTREELIRRFMGRSGGLVQVMIEDHLGRRLSSAEAHGIGARFTQAFEQELRAVIGVSDALDAITQPVCVASGSNPSALRRKLALCGLLERFDGCLFSATEVANGKPAPDLFLLAARRMGVDPARCVVVEDSPYGVQAARAAGMRAFAYVGGMVTRETLSGPGTVLFDDMLALPELLLAA